MHKVIYKREFSFGLAYGDSEKNIIEPEITVQLHITCRDGIWFSVNVPNKSFCGRNIFKLFINALESQTVGMIKYDRLKEDCRSKGLWNKLG
jgi:hypothetical protein